MLKYALHLADNALVLGHRNSEWTGHGPILEQDIALSNVALDLIGQARHFYQWASEIKNDGTSEDDLAYLRDAGDFLNCLLVEQPNGDWGNTLLRQFFFSAYQVPLYQQLKHHSENQLSAIAEKSLKEVTYHLRWSSEWVVRLGQGTEESHARMQAALDNLWPFTGELYTPADYEKSFADLAGVKKAFDNTTSQILDMAGLAAPGKVTMNTGGKEGRHTAHLSALLEEMQYMQRTYPGMEW